MYDLSKSGVGSRLVYDNSIYVGICGIAGDSDNSQNAVALPKGGYDSGLFDFPVFDVATKPEATQRHVTLRKKKPGNRSQLWYLSSHGFLVHEGSTAPHAPLNRRGRLLSRENSWVLDVDTSETTVTEAMFHCALDPRTLENFEIGLLCLSRISSRRKNTQTWQFKRGFLINAASFCVQARRIDIGRAFSSSTDVVFVARPKYRGVKSGTGVGQSLVSESLGAARVFCTWLRPGSGSLHVEVVTEGPVRVLQISDPEEPDHAVHSICRPYRSESIRPTSLRFLLDLPSGLGVSVISARCEELCYASLLGLRFSVERFYPASGAFTPSIDIAQEATDNEEVQDFDTVFVETSDQPQSCGEDEFLTHLISEGRPVEHIRLHLGRIQIDNQIAGASLPVLLFRSVPSGSTFTAALAGKSSSGGVIEGKPLRNSESVEWIRGRELGRLLSPPGVKPAPMGSRPNQMLNVMPNLIMRSLRLLHTGWKAQIFTLMEVRLLVDY